MQPDWIVTRLVDRGFGHPFRYIVEGVNLNHPAGHPSRTFRWEIPQDPRTYGRYDCSAAVVG